jgi:hypothetical protein
VPAHPVLLLEPLNAAERKSPLLRDVANVEAIWHWLGRPAELRLLFDCYHSFQEEDVVQVLRRVGHLGGHMQVADFPGRGEPGTGRLPFSRKQPGVLIDDEIVPIAEVLIDAGIAVGDMNAVLGSLPYMRPMIEAYAKSAEAMRISLSSVRLGPPAPAPVGDRGHRQKLLRHVTSSCRPVSCGCTCRWDGPRQADVVCCC